MIEFPFLIFFPFVFVYLFYVFFVSFSLLRFDQNELFSAESWNKLN